MIRNTTKRTELVARYRVCRTHRQKARGLMFEKQLRNEALLFAFSSRQRIGLHMFFVFQTIDIVVLGDHYRVIELREGLRPWQLYTSQQASDLLLELPAGTVARSRTQVGDTLEIR